MGRFTTSKHKNLDMNKETYKLRRQVINVIREIGELVDLPRINVRITDPTKGNEQVMGSALLRGNTIWITQDTIKNTDVRTVVYHEVLHAVYGTQHDEDCPLMKSTFDRALTKKECVKYFLKHASRHSVEMIAL